MRPDSFARAAHRPRLAGARGSRSLGQPEPEACSGAERSLGRGASTELAEGGARLFST